MAPKRITKTVTEEVAARIPDRIEAFGRMLPGDEFLVTGRNGRTLKSGMTNARWRFLHVDPNGDVHCFGPLDSGREKLRTFRADAVQMPSQRRLNRQRERRETE